MSEERLYTVEEAGSMLDDLRERLPRIREARNELLASAERIEGRATGNGGGGEGRGYWKAMRSLRTDVEYLSERSIVLRDPDTGLVDFPAERNGRPIFLCWRLGEGGIGYWHDEDAGFTGRKPLESK